MNPSKLLMYTATKTGKGFGNGQVYVQVEYTDGADKFEEAYKSEVIGEDWPDSIIRARLDRLNSIDMDSVELGDVKPKPEEKAPSAPTPEELARTAWLSDLREWRRVKAEFELGLSKTAKQDDVDAAYGLVKEGYLPEYGEFLI